MTSSGNMNDDDYIAELLAKDARDSSLKYSAMGMAAFLPKRPTSAAPKPNKRFLTNLLRETDSHNAALKKKEELEAKMRARGEPLAPSKSSRDRNVEGSREYESRKRRRVDDHEDSRSRSRSRSRDRKRGSRHAREHSEDRSYERHGHSRKQKHRGTVNSDHERHHRSRRRSPMEPSDRHNNRDRSPSTSSFDAPARHRSSKKDHNIVRRRSRSRSRSIPRHHDNLSRKDRERARRGHDSHHERRRLRSTSLSQSRSPSPGARRTAVDVPLKDKKGRSLSLSRSDSDPLEELVGPLPLISSHSSSNDPPPLRSRGRGAYRPSASAMDAHFASSYDPATDVRPDFDDENEKDDWDMALEALRDRELWKRKGAERLRAAGFGDEDIKKWEDSGKEKGIEDVKWSSKGEAREWDRGKVVETEGGRKGEVSLQAAWTRKDSGLLRDFKKALE